jgi:hypothetical protein
MPLTLLADLGAVTDVLGSQQEQFLESASVAVLAAYGTTLAALGRVLEWVILASLPWLQPLRNRFLFPL